MSEIKIDDVEQTTDQSNVYTKSAERRAKCRMNFLKAWFTATYLATGFFSSLSHRFVFPFVLNCWIEIVVFDEWT